MSGEKRISHEDILKDREWRWEKQRELLDRYRLPLVSLKLNIPGDIKSNSLYIKIINAGINAFLDKIEEKSMEKIWYKCYYKDEGPIFLGVLNIDSFSLKRLTLDIEEKHPLGRLFDFDVWENSSHQLSRRELGYGFRKCFLCEENAFICSRTRRHSVEELLVKINKEAEAYFSTL
ncbi:citrate lyase holo-[acyl-carrier protein] synthase [Alloiococcus sp. CFN-8]|uniref:citrate lyase holo-[acyl-carrier protein] synthase n=1 Tax=Alloiococcus sp. CFN-8 TaxID=3416081 RepID=UPI003CEC8FE1